MIAKGQGHSVTQRISIKNAIIQARISCRRSKLCENYPRAERNTMSEFDVIRSNIEIAITPPRIARLRSNLVQFHHVRDDTLQMLKVKGQRSRSQHKVMYQQQKH